MFCSWFVKKLEKIRKVKLRFHSKFRLRKLMFSTPHKRILIFALSPILHLSNKLHETYLSSISGSVITLNDVSEQRTLNTMLFNQIQELHKALNSRTRSQQISPNNGSYQKQIFNNGADENNVGDGREDSVYESKHNVYLSPQVKVPIRTWSSSPGSSPCVLLEFCNLQPVLVLWCFNLNCLFPPLPIFRIKSLEKTVCWALLICFNTWWIVLISIFFVWSSSKTCDHLFLGQHKLYR